MKRPSALLAVAAAALVLASCGDSGADVDGGIVVIPPGPTPVVPDFFLRQDVHLGGTQVADALAVDLNDDGLLDLVEANFSDNTIRIAFADGLGGFTAGFLLPTPNAAWRLAAAEMNGDGLTDIVVAVVDNPGGGVPAVVVFLQESVGVFGDSRTLELGFDPLDVVIVPVGGIPDGPASDLILLTENKGKRVTGVVFDDDVLLVAGTLTSESLVAGSPNTVDVIDMFNDDVLDVIVGEIEVDKGLPDRVLLYPGGGGKFSDGGLGFGSPEIVISNAAEPIVRTLGDLDGNGFDDLGVAQLDADTVLLVYADASGFGPFDVFNAGGPTSSVVSGDLDGSGPLDLAVTVLLTQELLIFHGLGPAPGPSGGASFGAPIRFNVGPLPRAIGVSELLPTGGGSDILSVSNEDLSILEGNGSGNYRGARGYPVGEGPALVECHDLDGDEDLDVVAIDVFQRQVSFLENIGVNSGTFELVTEVPFTIPAPNQLPGGFDVADVDGDGMPDVVVALNSIAEVHVLRNPGGLNFGPAAPGDIYPLGAGLFGVAIADANGDSAPDVFVSSSGDDTVRVLLNDPGEPGTFVEESPVSLSFTPGAIIADERLDEDGDLDLALTGVQSGDGLGGAVLGILEGDNTGNFVEAALLPISVLGATLHCADFDDNGLCDLAAGQPSLANTDVPYFLNNGSFSFEERLIDLTEGSPGALDIGDVDRDGDLDILIPTGEGELRIALGDGQGNFPDLEPPGLGMLPVPQGTSHSCYVQVDGDALDLPDLVIVSPEAPNLWIGRNVSQEVPQE